MDLKDWLSAAEARCERASKGPWRTERRSVFADNPSRYIAEMQRAVELSCLRDAEFIAAARSDLPRALELLRKALEVVQAAQNFVEHLEPLPLRKFKLPQAFKDYRTCAEAHDPYAECPIKMGEAGIQELVGKIHAFDAAVKDEEAPTLKRGKE